MNALMFAFLIILIGLFTLLAINEYIDRKKKKSVRSS